MVDDRRKSEKIGEKVQKSRLDPPNLGLHCFSSKGAQMALHRASALFIEFQSPLCRAVTALCRASECPCTGPKAPCAGLWPLHFPLCRGVSALHRALAIPCTGAKLPCAGLDLSPAQVQNHPVQVDRKISFFILISFLKSFSLFVKTCFKYWNFIFRLNYFSKIHFLFILKFKINLIFQKFI